MANEGGADQYTDIEDKLVQLLLACAQGAGSHLLSLEAIRTARGQYGAFIRANREPWESVLPAAVFYARALGAAAAHRAAGAGRQFIEPPDFVEAGQLISGRAAIRCPFCQEE